MRKAILGLTAASSVISAGGALAQGLPNYEYTSTYQPNLAQIGVTPSLHDSVSGSGVGIAILDGYADYTHPDLAGKITVEFLYNGTFTSFGGHGTHVSGIAAASRNDAGVVGVAPGAYLYNFPVFDDRGWVAGDLGASALNRITTLNGGGANIRAVNMSYGPVAAGDVFLNNELNLFDDYRNQFVIVRAAGNSGINARNESYSGVASVNLSHLLIVGSVDANNRISSFSNKPGNACIGPKSSCSASEKMRNFWIVAPGRSIASAYPGGWAYMSGTSMAAPHVAGAVALVASDGLQRNVALTPSDIASILKQSATDLGTRGIDGVYGSGLLNVPAALSPVGGTSVATGETVESTTPTTGSGRTRSRATRGGFAAPELLSGMVVFDGFNRPFEVTDWGSGPAPDSLYLEDRIASVSGIVSSHVVADVNEDGYALMAWSSGEAAIAPASSFRLVSETADLRAAEGSPGVFYALTQTMPGRRAEAQSLDSLMYSALGEAAHIFDRAVSVSVRTKLSPDWSLSSFVLSSFDRIAYLPGMEAPVPFYWNHSSAHLTGLGVDRRFGEDWTFGVNYAALRETGSTVGADSRGVFAFGGSALTQTFGLTFSAALTDGIALSGFYSLAFIDGVGDVSSVFERAKGWRGDQFGVTAAATGFLAPHDALRVSAIKPLQITHGAVRAHVPVGREFDGSVRYDDRVSSFDSSNLPGTLRIEYLAPLGPVSAVLTFDVTDADVLSRGDLRYGVIAGLSYAF